MRLPSWLGSLLAPAEDPRPTARSTPLAEPSALLAELVRSKQELSELRQRVGGPLAGELESEAHALAEAEAALRLSMGERQAREAVQRARRRTLEAELLVDEL